MQLLVTYLVFVVIAGAVAADARRLGARRGALGGGFLDMGPVGWFFATVLLCLLSLACYLIIRPKLVRRAYVLQTYPNGLPAPVPAYGPRPYPGPWPPRPMAQHPMAQRPAQPLPPPGYYPNPDPSDGHGTRWWDGQQWAPPAT